MANPICFSPLKFYDDISKQCHRRSYAFNRISAPLIVRRGFLPCFQFVIPADLYTSGGTLTYAYLHNAETNEIVSENLANALFGTDFAIEEISGFRVATFGGQLPILSFTREGMFYLEVGCNNDVWHYYSEVFCTKSNLNDCIELEYWNAGNNPFYIKNGVIAFPGNFHFHLLLQTELGKPEYDFKEEATERGGYNFVESQVSKKTYKFNVVAPEYLCDAMRIIRLCSDKVIRTKYGELDALSFSFDVEWQTQGDLASVNCEFEVDNVINNLGGFVSPLIGGDFNDDYNQDFNTGEQQ